MFEQAMKSSQTIYTVVDQPAESKYIPNFPYIARVKFTGGESAVIRGTRVKVGNIVGYIKLGETPKTIVEQVLPFLKLEQVLDAVRYYEYHKEEIDEERRQNTEEAGREYLQKHLSDEQYRKLTGG